jgi:DUF971 family protein
MGLLDRVDLKRTHSAPPEEISLAADGQLRIVWTGEPEVKVPFKQLRDHCPCAECVEEWTGKKVLDPATIPDDIRPVRIDPVGNYAIQISWSDGHASGLYTWDTLRKAALRPAPSPR